MRRSDVAGRDPRAAILPVEPAAMAKSARRASAEATPSTVAISGCTTRVI